MPRCVWSTTHCQECGGVPGLDREEAKIRPVVLSSCRGVGKLQDGPAQYESPRTEPGPVRQVKGRVGPRGTGGSSIPNRGNTKHRLRAERKHGPQKASVTEVQGPGTEGRVAEGVGALACQGTPHES